MRTEFVYGRGVSPINGSEVSRLSIAIQFRYLSAQQPVLFLKVYGFDPQVFYTQHAFFVSFRPTGGSELPLNNVFFPNKCHTSQAIAKVEGGQRIGCINQLSGFQVTFLGNA